MRWSRSENPLAVLSTGFLTSDTSAYLNKQLPEDVAFITFQGSEGVAWEIARIKSRDVANPRHLVLHRGFDDSPVWRHAIGTQIYAVYPQGEEVDYDKLVDEADLPHPAGGQDFAARILRKLHRSGRIAINRRTRYVLRHPSAAGPTLRVNLRDSEGITVVGGIPMSPGDVYEIHEDTWKRVATVQVDYPLSPVKHAGPLPYLQIEIEED